MAAIGLFGGTFDPIHFGHLRLATELAEAFHLDQVLFVPAGLPYHRGRSAHATSEQRLTMLKLATARDARFDIDERELRREGNTYTYDTLAEMRRERGPDASLVFLAGSDAFAKIDEWHRWTELFDLAHFAIAIRADDAQWSSKGPGAFPREAWPRITLNLREMLAAPAGKIMTFAMTPLAISSTAIRALAAGLSRVTGLRASPGSSLGEVADIPLTAHFLGGAVISDRPEHGVVDPYQRVWGYPGVHVLDGAAVSANLGVNPALTITAQAERAMALWPVRGEADARPAQGEAYRRLDPVPAS